jgi:hypothetical protein
MGQPSAMNHLANVIENILLWGDWIGEIKFNPLQMGGFGRATAQISQRFTLPKQCRTKRSSDVTIGACY